MEMEKKKRAFEIDRVRHLPFIEDGLYLFIHSPSSAEKMN